MRKDMQDLMSSVTEVTDFYSKYAANGTDHEALEYYLKIAVEMEKLAQLRGINQSLEVIAGVMRRRED